MLKDVFREISGLPQNKGEVQQFALKEAWRILRSAKVFDPATPSITPRTVTIQIQELNPPLVTTELTVPFNFSQSLREKTVTLANGDEVRNIPANLDISEGQTVRAWRNHRNLRIADVADAMHLSKGGLSYLETDKNYFKDSTILAVSEVLRVPPGVLVTRLRPQDVFTGEPGIGSGQDEQFPEIELHSDREYGEVFRAWREYFGLNQTEMAKVLGPARNYVSMLEHNHLRPLPPKLKDMIERLRSSLNLPAGVILTRHLPQEVIIKQQTF